MSFPGSRPPGWRLKPIGKYGLPSSIDVARTGITLGRDRANSCAIVGDRWTMVSALHARLEFEGPRLCVHDLDSTNGTWLNDVRVEAAELSSGDVLQLGRDGPRFLVFHAVGAETTVMVEGRAALHEALGSPTPSLGETALVSLKRALGLDENHAATIRMESRQRRQWILGGVALCTLACAGVVGFTHVSRDAEQDVRRVEKASEARVRTLEEASSRRVAQVERQNAELERANLALAARLEAGLERVGTTLEQRIADSYVARETWDLERAALEAQRQEIEARLSELKSSRDGSQEELQLLSKRLETTLGELARYNPGEIEAGKLAEVMHVRSAVVMIETRVIFREQETRRLLHLALDAEGGQSVNLRDEGDVLDQRSTGSGFVISKNGYILTNAHVAVPSEFREPLSITEDNEVLPEVELHVVFSGTSKRYVANLVHLDAEGDHDFALLQIEAFEGMPHLELADLDATSPEPGTEVYLCGFPLGTFAVQEGDRVIASTLKGILSRNVGPYFQIDAGVHPGISGGPVTNSSGKVIGVVCSVQATPKGEIAATIGYALPIASARRVLSADVLR